MRISFLIELTRKLETMNTLPLFAAIASAAFLVACDNSGANYTPIIDGPPSVAFQSDLAACQSLARAQRQFDQEILGATAIGAGTGALLGQADSGDAWGSAVVGAVARSVSGAVDVAERRQAIVVACLRGRGHAVVG